MVPAPFNFLPFSLLLQAVVASCGFEPVAAPCGGEAGWPVHKPSAHARRLWAKASKHGARASGRVMTRGGWRFGHDDPGGDAEWHRAGGGAPVWRLHSFGPASHGACWRHANFF